MFDLEQAINGRRSTHKPVPRELVGEALELATRAPSNSNVQPWHLVLVSGPARDRLVAALLDVAGSKPPRVPPLPEAFEHYRLDVGAEVYGSMGIARDDVEGRRIAKLRNWEFFRRAAGRDRLHASRPPPRRQPRRWHVPADIGPGPHTARGLGTCVHLAIAGYPEIVHEQLNIPEELMILCGLAAGYSDPDFLANQLRIGRNAIEKNVVFLRLLADS